MRREPLTAARFPLCLFTPLVERQMILVDHQCSIRQICRSAYIETAISVPFVGMTDVKAGRSTVRVTPGTDVQLPRAGIRLARILSGTFKRWRDSLQRWARPLAADRALVHRAARRLGHPASIPRAIMSRSPEALAFGSRRHFIPASLSLPLCGCLLNRSRDCSRSRVPPLSASALC